VHVQLGTWGGRLGVTPGPGDAEAAVLALGAALNLAKALSRQQAPARRR
jgi:hypothetical protein